MIENSQGIKKYKYLYQYFYASIILGAVFIIGITVGKYPISIRDIIKILVGLDVDPMVRKVFFGLRLPRVLMGLIAGVGLSITGSIYQTIFKNPLATPDIIGVTSGANLGAAIAIVFFSGGTFTIAINAFIGGIVAVYIALFLTRFSRNNEMLNFILSGIIIGSLAQGLIMLLKFFADPERQLAAMEFWSMGSLAGVTQDKVFAILPFFIIGIILLYIFRWQINILSLSDEEGTSLGINVNAIRWGVILSATLVVSSIVCITGLISFIGLIAPHIARMITKRNDINTTILSGFIGSILLIVADCFARCLAGSEIPISILTTFIGAPFLGYLMSRLR